MTGRELAWRVLASELNASTAEEKGSGEKSPSYVVSPLGARMNRVLMIGTVTPLDRPTTGQTGGFVRARLTDPTGVVPVTTSSFQPQGQVDLERLAGPTRAIVVGKVALIRGMGASPVPSVRAEAVHPVPEIEFQTLTAEAAVQTLERLALALRLRSEAPPTVEDLTRAGVSPQWVRGAQASVSKYPTLDPSPFYESARVVLAALRAAPTPERPTPTPERAPAVASEVVRVTRPRSLPEQRSPPPGLQALEGRLLEILDQLAEESPDGYADMDELAERAARHGLEGERMEELLNYLSENGTLEEPLVGKFRRAEGPPRE
jgi:uncharacterized protein